MTAIKRAFETEKEYREFKAQNFSKLSAFWHDGLYSPDHALKKIEHKSYFEYGKMFESLLQDTVKGTRDFNSRFFITAVQGKVPDKLVEWIDNGADLEEKRKKFLNKDGSRSRTHRVLHAFLDECAEYPGMIPVSIEDAEMLKLHVERMCEMPYINVKVGDLLANGEWQVPIVWEDDDGNVKKALLDVLVDIGGEILPLDIKTAAEEGRFYSMLRKKYWIQDLHYTEGVNASIGPALQMIFLVAYKSDPFVCGPVTVDYGEEWPPRKAIEEYQDLCNQYAMWSGSPRGWLPLTAKRFYLPR